MVNLITHGSGITTGVATGSTTLQRDQAGPVWGPAPEVGVSLAAIKLPLLGMVYTVYTCPLIKMVINWDGV